MIELVCLRHAQTEWNLAKRMQGRADIALNATGLAWSQEHSIPAPYSDWNWFVSPLLRARQTAAGLGIAAQCADALIETDFGLWEGQTLKGLRSADPEGFRANEDRGLDLQPPQGESPRAVQGRVLQWIRTLAPGRYGAICHKGVMRALLAEALNWPLLGACPLKIDWQALQHFRWSRETGLELVQANIGLLSVRQASRPGIS